MLGIFGISNYSVPHIRGVVRKQLRCGKPDGPTLAILGKGMPYASASVLLVVGVGCLRTYRTRLQTSKSAVLVFDSPLNLSTVRPMVFLDTAYAKISGLYIPTELDVPNVTKLLHNSLVSTAHVDVEIQGKQDVATAMLGQQLVSVLNPIQTFLYSVRDAEKRTQYQHLVYGWLVSTRNRATLEREITRLMGQEKIPKAVASMLNALDEQEGMRKAFQEVHRLTNERATINYKAIGTQYKVAPFDLRYTANVLKKLGKYKWRTAVKK